MWRNIRMENLNKGIESSQRRRSARLIRRAAIIGVVGVGIIAGAQSLAYANAAPQPLGDYTGDNKTDIALWRPSNGTWYWIDSTSGTQYSQQWGLPGDVPVSANYNYASSDGNRSDLTVWRPSNGTFYWVDSGTWSFWQFGLGQQGDIPVAGDFDGDGKSDFAIWRGYRDAGNTAGMWQVVN